MHENQELRNPQIINGEMQPRHHFIGLESVRRLHHLVEVFREAGINLLAIPMIKEVEAGMLAEDFEVGTVLGCTEPIFPPRKDGLRADIEQVLVWDGAGISAMSIAMYLHKMDNNWRLPGEEGYQQPNFHPERRQATWVDQSEVQPEKSRSKKTTPKHLRRKKRFNKAHDRYNSNQRGAR